MYWKRLTILVASALMTLGSLTCAFADTNVSNGDLDTAMVEETLAPESDSYEYEAEMLDATLEAPSGVKITQEEYTDFVMISWKSNTNPSCSFSVYVYDTKTKTKKLINRYIDYKERSYTFHLGEYIESSKKSEELTFYVAAEASNGAIAYSQGVSMWYVAEAPSFTKYELIDGGVKVAWVGKPDQHDGY